jgi:multicomponent Na+:H+ antiporter subunit G
LNHREHGGTEEEPGTIVCQQNLPCSRLCDLCVLSSYSSAVLVMSLALNVFTIAAVSSGTFFFLAGTVGLLRFPDTLTRLHALTKADNLGLGLIMLGLLPHVAWPFGALKLVAVWVLVLVASASASRLIARKVHDS